MPRQPYDWEWKGSCRAPHSTLEFYPEFASHACVPVWRSHPFSWRINLAEWEKGRVCELESGFPTQLFTQPCFQHLPPPPSSGLPLTGCCRWASPLRPVALSKPLSLSALRPSPCHYRVIFFHSHQPPPHWFGEEMEVDVGFKSAVWKCLLSTGGVRWCGGDTCHNGLALASIAAAPLIHAFLSSCRSGLV